MGKRNVYLFVPNIIGYLRILLLVCSFYFIMHNHRLAMLLYSISYAMDAIDGLAARIFKQSSLFGSMLDMLTDRVATMFLLITLAHLYPEHHFNIQLLAGIDIVSHWLHFFSASIQGKNSHKSSDLETNILMRYYYENKLILSSVCAMEQIFYSLYVVMHFERNLLPVYVTWILWFVCGLGVAFKNMINVMQILGACRIMVRVDEAQLYHAQ